MSRARGSTLLLTMVIITALLGLGTLFAMKLEVDIAARRTQHDRLAALWLGRSALNAGVTGTSTVPLSLGAAKVEVSAKGDRREAVVTLNGSRATVTSAQGVWTERFERRE